MFFCYTSLDYVDFNKLKLAELVEGIDGKLWIYAKWQKTDTVPRIALLPDALSIVRSYDQQPQCVADDRLLRGCQTKRRMAI